MHHHWVEFLPKKSDVVSCLQRWKLQAEHETDLKLQCLKSDGGKEFRSKVFEEWLVADSVIHEKSAPYEHKQNGLAERGIQHQQKIFELWELWRTLEYSGVLKVQRFFCWWKHFPKSHVPTIQCQHVGRFLALHCQNCSIPHQLQHDQHTPWQDTSWSMDGQMTLHQAPVHVWGNQLCTHPTRNTEEMDKKVLPMPFSWIHTKITELQDVGSWVTKGSFQP